MEPLEYMRGSLSYCEPKIALAGQINTWEFLFKTGSALPKGTKLRFDLMSEGREIDWEVPSSGARKVKGVLFAELENGTTLEAVEVWKEDYFTPVFDFVLKEKVAVGQTIKFIMGSRKKDAESRVSQGVRAQIFTQRRRPFSLSIDPKGKDNFQDTELFHIDIRGNKLVNIRILCPSFVIKNRRFDAIVRFEDEFGNLTSNAPEDTLVTLTHENIRENLDWKIFVPETGFITLPNLYFNEPGNYTFQLSSTHTNEKFYSPPIKCFSENERGLFWGLFHGESERIDSTENIESCLRHFRDDKALNFYGSSPSESKEETSNDTWRLISQNISDFNESDRFATYLGFQWVGDKSQEGIRQLIYLKDNKPLYRRKELKNCSLKKLYSSHTPREMISIPCFTMNSENPFNFDTLFSDYERVVEIYNAWGSSECTKEEGNDLPISAPGAKGLKESKEGSILDALKRNRRFGFIAGGLDDRGCYADLFDNNQVQYPPGLTAILSKDLTRNALFDALYKRLCYATTGPRIILNFTIASFPMGSELNTKDKPGLKVNRHIEGYVAGTSSIDSVEIIRNGIVIKSFSSEEYHLDFTFDDMDPLDQISLKDEDGAFFCFYYLRVTQTDGHKAWSSPIWVDKV